jgi:hypothetical protein
MKGKVKDYRKKASLAFVVCAVTLTLGVLGKYTLEADILLDGYDIGATVTMSGGVFADGEGLPEALVTITDSCGNVWTISDGGATDQYGLFSASTIAGPEDGVCEVDVSAVASEFEGSLDTTLYYEVFPAEPIKAPKG